MTNLNPEALERAAKAIYAKEYDIEAYQFENEPEFVRKLLLWQAEAAILTYLGKEYVVVPVEPTEAMIEAALDSHAAITPCESPFGENGYFAEIYRAMLKASTEQEGG